MYNRFIVNNFTIISLVVLAVFAISIPVAYSSAGFSYIPPTPAFETIKANVTDVIADSFNDLLHLTSTDSSILITGVNYGAGALDANYPDWNFRKTITINSTQVDANLTGFPVLISTTDTDLRDNALSNADDIIFVNSDGATQLPHEIEKYDSVTGELVAWVKEDLTSATDTIIYMYYGNSAATNSEDECTLWSDYDRVFHLHDDFDDSACNANATNSGSTDVTGNIADGQEFDGISDYVSMGTGTGLDTANNWTISTWVYVDNITTNHMMMSQFGTTAPNQSMLFFFDDVAAVSGRTDAYVCLGVTPASAYIRIEGATGSGINQTWQYVVCTFEGNGDLSLYVDGAEDANSPVTFTSSTVKNTSTDMRLGEAVANWNDMDGRLDESRIRLSTLSAEWISTEFNNQGSPSTFYSISSQQSFGLTDTIDFTLASASNSTLGGVFATDCSPNSLQTVHENGTITCSSGGGGGAGATVPQVIYSETLSTDVYTWQFNIDPYEFLEIHSNFFMNDTNSVTIHMRFNNDTANNYGYGPFFSDQALIDLYTGNTDDYYRWIDIFNLESITKTGGVTGNSFNNGTATYIGSAVDSPFVYNGTGMVTTLNFTTSNTNNAMASGSFINVIGWNSTE